MQTVEAAVIKMADHVENCEKLQIAAVSERRAMASEQTAIKREARLYAVMIFVAVVAAIFEGHLHFVMQ